VRVQVELDTMADVAEFVSTASQVPETVHLVSGDFRVSAKSLLGAVYTMEWAEVWCECSADIYSKISKFVV
jgi:hypothetical protein